MSSSHDSPTTGTGDDIDLESLDVSQFRSRTGSFKSSALPHKHVSDGLEWTIDYCKTDQGESVPSEPSTNTLSLIGKDWNTVTISATVTFPTWVHDIVVPDETDRDDDWSARIGLKCWCRQTIYRVSSPTVRAIDSGEYELTLEVDRNQVSQSLKIEPALVLVDGGSTDDGYASTAGHRLAEGEAWTLKTDLARTTKNLLHPETKRFSEDDDLPGDDHLVFVDFERNPPGVYLNGDHERIVAALDSDANQGWEAAVREVAYDTIEAEVWPQMILEAAADVSRDSGPEVAWKQGVIEKFRERIYEEGTSYDEAVDYLYEDLSSPERLARLMGDIDDAIQTRNDAPSHLNKLLSLVDNR